MVKTHFLYYINNYKKQNKNQIKSKYNSHFHSVSQAPPPLDHRHGHCYRNYQAIPFYIDHLFTSKSPAYASHRLESSSLQPIHPQNDQGKIELSLGTISSCDIIELGIALSLEIHKSNIPVSKPKLPDELS